MMHKRADREAALSVRKRVPGKQLQRQLHFPLPHRSAQLVSRTGEISQEETGEEVGGKTGRESPPAAGSKKSRPRAAELS
jgi:hypothetical protein